MPKNFNPNKQTFVAGEAALVGAGPGDPDLLTLQAYRFITQADVAIYDRLVSDEIMALLPQGCEKIYVGKKQADHKVPQERINEIIVEQAKLGKRVVRLKGGDPLVFGPWRRGSAIRTWSRGGMPYCTRHDRSVFVCSLCRYSTDTPSSIKSMYFDYGSRAERREP